MNSKLGRDRTRSDAVRLNSVEGIKQALDIGFGLWLAPALTRVTIVLVQPSRRGFLNANLAHERRTPGQARLRAITSAAVSGL